MSEPEPKAQKVLLTAGELERFREELLAWFRVHQRDLPWRRTRDPYAIWISEIMLQQTRVAAVIPFYERFLRRFPDFTALADAPEADLLAHWAGLGYYYRARNLQKAAKSMHGGGAFPATHEEIRMLAGVGDYTSAAVGSIAFGLPHAVVDGNVLRVLSRLLADPTDIGSPRGRKHFAVAAERLLARDEPGAFNQAMMELGATVCLPRNPQCLLCPVADLCRAKAGGRQAEFPVKSGRVKSVDVERTLFWVEDEGRLLAWQRPASSRLMPGFWELPEPEHLPGVEAGRPIGAFRHGITFHNYRFTLHRTAAVPTDVGACVWLEFDGLAQLPVSTVFRKARRVLETKKQKPDRLVAAVTA